jgi:hypothetical protein
MESGKEQKNTVEGPISDPVNLGKNRLEEEKKKPDAEHFANNHHEKMRPIGHAPHQPHLDE